MQIRLFSSIFYFPVALQFCCSWLFYSWFPLLLTFSASNLNLLLTFTPLPPKLIPTTNGDKDATKQPQISTYYHSREELKHAIRRHWCPAITPDKQDVGRCYSISFHYIQPLPVPLHQRPPNLPLEQLMRGRLKLIYVEHPSIIDFLTNHLDLNPW